MGEGVSIVTKQKSQMQREENDVNNCRDRITGYKEEIEAAKDTRREIRKQKEKYMLDNFEGKHQKIEADNAKLSALKDIITRNKAKIHKAEEVMRQAQHRHLEILQQLQVS